MCPGGCSEEGTCQAGCACQESHIGHEITSHEEAGYEDTGHEDTSHQEAGHQDTSAEGCLDCHDVHPEASAEESGREIHREIRTSHQTGGQQQPQRHGVGTPDRSPREEEATDQAGGESRCDEETPNSNSQIGRG